MTKNYEPVADAIWLEYDMDSVAGHGSNLVMPDNAKLPPFVEAEVLAVGPKCTQVKAGDTVLVNSSTILKMKVVGSEEVLFTKEPQIVAIVRPAI